MTGAEQDESVRKRYYEEMAQLIKKEYGAREVIVLNDIVRNATKADQRGSDNPFAGGGNGVNGYANVVHTDFRAAKARTKLHEQPKREVHGKFMLVNAWRNISDHRPIYNNTLACCDQQTVASPADYCRVDVPISEEAQAEQYRLWTHSAPRHLWYYFPHMMKDEVLLFTQYDSDTHAPARFCFHTAFYDPAVDANQPPRESVEVRAIAFFGHGPDRRSEAFSISHLLKQLAQGASHRLVQASELPDLVDEAAYSGKTNETFIKDLCAERNLTYQDLQWQPGPGGEGILEELKALNVFERRRFLNPPADEQEDPG